MPVRFLSLLAASACLVAPAALASSLQIGPIRVQMIGPERTSTLTLRNSGPDPMTVQIRAIDWTQADVGDNPQPSATLLVSPPLVTLNSGESQVVRVVAENVPAGPNERAYRLILDEIPRQRSGTGTGVQTTLRALVPVFITPSTRSRSNLRWNAVREGNVIRLTARNDGQARDKLVATRVSAAGTELSDPPNGYVLSGTSRTWTLPAPAGAATSLRISAEGEFGAIEADVPIGS
jgi:fimbrial chaperone protein